MRLKQKQIYEGYGHKSFMVSRQASSDYLTPLEQYRLYLYYSWGNATKLQGGKASLILKAFLLLSP